MSRRMRRRRKKSNVKTFGTFHLHHRSDVVVGELVMMHDERKKWNMLKT